MFLQIIFFMLTFAKLGSFFLALFCLIDLIIIHFFISNSEECWERIIVAIDTLWPSASNLDFQFPQYHRMMVWLVVFSNDKNNVSEIGPR